MDEAFPLRYACTALEQAKEKVVTSFFQTTAGCASLDLIREVKLAVKRCLNYRFWKKHVHNLGRLRNATVFFFTLILRNNSAQ
jgi:hypothetical protein